MTRFEQLVLSDHRDVWGIPRRTGVALVNVAEIALVRDVTIDTTFQAALSPGCPAGVYPALEVTLRSGRRHELLLGQFDDVADAARELNRFAVWLTGRSLR